MSDECNCASCREWEGGAFLPSGPPAGTNFSAETAKFLEDKAVAEGAMRAFDTGATRNVEVDPDIYGFTSPLALGLFCQYMHEHRTQADGSVRESDNWKKGIPMDSYIRSLRRHLQDLTLHHDGYGHLAREDVVSAMAGIMFNIQGYMHEYVKGADAE